MVAAVAAALAIQFLGGGLWDIIEAHEMAPGPGGGGGGVVVSWVLEVRWRTGIPLALAIAAVVCLTLRGHDKPAS